MTTSGPPPFAQHGGPDAAGPVPHDFSTNGNACGPCPTALAAVRAADPRHYPDPASTALREALAALHGVAVSRIVIAASGSEFIQRISAAVALGGGRRVAVPAHGYGDYARAARACGMASTADAGPGAGVDAEPDHATAVHTGADAATAVGPDLVWACDPSSPTGAATSPPDPSAREPVRVLDCAYEPLRLEGTAWPVAARDRCWQLWTPNKALGLTGVRAAYAIAPLVDGAPATLRARLDALTPSWPLGAHGVALLHAWTRPDTARWLDHSRIVLRAWKAAQLAVVRDQLGWPCTPGVASFFVAEPNVAPALLLPALRRHGVRLRDCASFGLPGRVRLAVLPPDSQRALVAAVRTVDGSTPTIVRRR